MDSNRKELSEAALAYIENFDQDYLEITFDQLWEQEYDLEAFILLSTALHAARWENGRNLGIGVVEKYFRGLIRAVSNQALLPTCLDFICDDLFIQQVAFNDKKDRAAITMVYVGLMIVYPNTISPDLLWKYRDEVTPYLSNSWERVLNRLANGLPLTIVTRDQIDFTRIGEIVERIDQLLERQNNGPINLLSSFADSYLANLAREHKLGNHLYHGWETIKSLDPLSPQATHLRDQIFSDINHYMREARNNVGNSPVTRMIENKFDILISLINEYFKLHLEKNQISRQLPVVYQELVEDLESISNIIGPSATTIVKEALEDFTFRGRRNLSLSEDGRSTGFQERLTALLLNRESLLLSLPQAIVWINQQFIQDVNDWQKLFLVLMRSIAYPLSPDRIIQNFLDANLPHLAHSVALHIGNRDSASQANEILEKLRVEIAARQNELALKGKILTEQEQEWLRQERYPLVLRSLREMQDKLSKEQREAETRAREVLNTIYQETIEIHKRLGEIRTLPYETSAEVIRAVGEVQRTCINMESNKIEVCQELLSEIHHLLDYPGAGSDGVQRVFIKLTSKEEEYEKLVRNGESQKTVKNGNGNLDKFIQALRDNHMVDFGFSENALTHQQREDRARLIELWQQITEGEAINFKDLHVLSGSKKIEAIKEFAFLFAKLTQLFYGDIPQFQTNRTHFFLAFPIPHFESKFIRPRTSTLQKNIALLFVDDVLRDVSIPSYFQKFLVDEPWLRRGDFIVLITTQGAERMEEWVRQHYPRYPIVVFDEKKFLEIIITNENPTATGAFRGMLLRISGPDRFDVFKFENQVDSDSEIFVGRRNWLDLLVNSSQSHVIYGGRKIGKSSLLNATAKELQKRGAITAYVSLEGSADNSVDICTEILQKLNIDYRCQTINDFRIEFQKFLQKNPDRKVIILLDEVDRYITARKDQSHDLIHTFRAIYQQNHGVVRFIVAGFIETWRHLQRESIAGQQNPWFNFFNDNGPLTGLDSGEAQAIVRQGFQEILGISLEDLSIPRKIVEYTTGHPAFVQKFCERLHRRLTDQRRSHLSFEDLEAVFHDRSPRNFLDFVNNTLNQNLNTLSRLAVYLIASHKKDVFSVLDVQKIANSFNPAFGSIAEEYWGKSLDELIVTSVIVRTQEPFTYRFSIPSYPIILNEYDSANSNNIFQLMNEIERGLSRDKSNETN